MHSYSNYYINRLGSARLLHAITAARECTTPSEPQHQILKTNLELGTDYEAFLYYTAIRRIRRFVHPGNGQVFTRQTALTEARRPGSGLYDATYREDEHRAPCVRAEPGGRA